MIVRYADFILDRISYNLRHSIDIINTSRTLQALLSNNSVAIALIPLLDGTISDLLEFLDFHSNNIERTDSFLRVLHSIVIAVRDNQIQNKNDQIINVKQNDFIDRDDETISDEDFSPPMIAKSLIDFSNSLNQKMSTE